MRDHATNVGRGALMGAADLVPGVSGGTMALIVGIHPRLVAAIAAVDVALPRDAWRALRGDADARTALRRLDLPLLLPLALGILLAIFLGAGAVHAALEHHPGPSMAFFLGLLLASVPVPWRHVKQHGRATWAAAASGVALVVALVYVPSAAWPTHAFGLGAAGFIAFMAMLLPGISGSGLLVLLGTYDVILAAAADRDVVALFPVALGGALGLAVISRALKWLFAHHHDRTFAFLTGLLVGSLLRVWPWRTLPGFSEGTPVVPTDGMQAALLIAYAAAGFLLVRVVDVAGRKPEHL